GQRLARCPCSIDCPARQEDRTAQASRLGRVEHIARSVEIAPAKALRVVPLTAAIASRHMIEGGMDEMVETLEQASRDPAPVQVERAKSDRRGKEGFTR